MNFPPPASGFSFETRREIGFAKGGIQALQAMSQVQPFVAGATKGCHSRVKGNGESDGDKPAGLNYGGHC